MKTFVLALCATAAGLAMAGAAMAQDAAPAAAPAAAPSLALTFNAGVANEYIFRGLSQSAGDPQVFAGADASYGMGYAGFWASNVEFGDGTNEETDFYAGVKPQALGISWDIGVIFYGYIRDPKNDEQYWEGKILGSAPFGPLTLGGAIYYSPDFPLKTGPATYFEANAAYTGLFTPKLSISGAIGHQDLDRRKYGLDGYTTWNLGVTYPLTSKVTVDARYIDTDSKARDFFPSKDNAPFNTGSKFIMTLKAAF